MVNLGKPLSSKTDYKGKKKAAFYDPEFEDIDPVITYRHLLSQNLGVKNPLRVVALCDSDAFYAACEQVRLSTDPEEPLVVLQWESLIAVNYPARKFGISRMDKVGEARKRCPNLRVVHVATFAEGEEEPGYWEKPDSRTHKVSLDLYRRESAKIIAMFKEGLPNGEVEKASIDEAFIDFTNPVREIVLKRYPYLSNVPPDAPSGLDTPLPSPPKHIDWSGVPIPITPTQEADDKGEGPSKQPDGLEDTHKSEEEAAPITWHDVALSIAAELMGKIRSDIKSKLGYSTSAGIARNKFLAKLSASYRKPNSQSILRNAAIPSYIRPMAFQKIRFLGGKLGKAIAEEYDVTTVSDLLTISLEEIQRRFGEGAIWVYDTLRGIDFSEVKEKTAVNKSMMAAKNLQKPVTKPSEGPHWVRVLAAELCLRLKEARELNPGLWPKSIVLHVRQNYQYSDSRSRQMAFPFNRNVTVDSIAESGNKLWKELVGTDDSRHSPLKVSHLALVLSGVEAVEAGQRSIDIFLNSPRQSSHLDGHASGKDVHSPRKRSTVDSGNPDGVVGTDMNHVNPSRTLSFFCKRCRQDIRSDKVLPSIHNVDCDEELDEDEWDQAVSRLKQEHDDFHFAHDLSFASDPPDQARTLPPKKKQKTRQSETGGIAKFLIRKS